MMGIFSERLCGSGTSYWQ